MTKKPLIATGIVTEFGDVLDNPATLVGQFGQSKDLTYVKGFSDLRYQRDVALGEVARGERDPSTVPVLPVNLRFVRRANAKGEGDHKKVMQSQVRGYTPVTEADLEAAPAWCPETPAGLLQLPDGTFGHGDTVLMKCDAKTAARNAAARQLKTTQLVSGRQAAAEGDGVDYETTTGTAFPVPAPKLDKR